MNDESKCYSLLAGKDFLTIKLSGNCDFLNIKGFEEDIEIAVQSDWPHVIVNCEHLFSLSNDWVRVLMRIQNEVRQNQKAMRLIMVNYTLKQQMVKNGVDSAFKSSPGLKEAKMELGLLTKKTLDTDFINPFLDATIHVLNVQASVKVGPGKPYLKNHSDKLLGDVSGVIGVVSDSFNGTFIISFPEKTFLAIMSSMLGEKFETLNQEIIDGAGEITNMIFGQAKLKLNEIGYGIKMAIPSVISGKDHSLSTIGKGPVIVLPFSGSAGDFFVEICLSE